MSPLALLINSMSARVVALLVALFAPFVANEARADAPLALLVLQTHSDATAHDAEVNRKLLAALEARRGYDLLPQPALDLEGTQLAIDCIGETPRCLREVAERAHAAALIAPSVVRKGGKVELRLLYFEAADRDAEPHRASRKQDGKELSQATLDAIPAMLRELMGEPEKAEEKPAVEAAPEPAESEPQAAAVDASAKPSPARKIPIGAVVLGGAGVAAIATGIVFGVISRDTQHDYAAQPITTQAQAKIADDTRKRGEREAVVANVLFGVGAGAIVASAVWLTLSLTERRTPETALVPMLGPDHAGLILYGSLGARE